MHALLHVWREASRHAEISLFLDRVVDVLGRRVPMDLILVRWCDAERARLETVAVSRRGAVPLPDHLRSECSGDDLALLRTWGRWNSVYHAHTDSGERLVTLVAPPGTAGDVLAGPLLDERGLIGVLVVIAHTRHAFTDDHRTLMQTVLEPFTMALRNDRRLHALARERDAAQAENVTLRNKLGEDADDRIIGVDDGLRDVMRRVAQVAPTEAPVLLLGETGSGKEVIARAIHQHSRRASGPLIKVNCGAITPSLIDSELFGHERGSFTGAVASRAGWFERANGGTLFLDEIGELPAEAQVRLLRILQDGTFERVGGQRTMSVDVRVIAATNRDLTEMVAAGSFRKDLWYRISVFPLTLPPLRERRRDLRDLVAHFAALAGRRLTGSALTPTAEDLELLAAYDWPGNVRELAAVIERAAILGGHRLDVATALGVYGSARPPAATRPPAETADADDDSLDDAMTRHIREALTRTQGRIEGPGGAAAILRVNPHTLRARMRKLGIEWSRYRMPPPAGSQELRKR